MGLASSGLWVGSAGARDEIEHGREREERVEVVEECRERALEARREFAGESGAGREDVSSSREARNELLLLREGDLGLLSGDGLTTSSVVVVVVGTEGRKGVIAGVVEHRGSEAGGLWRLGDGVEGETAVRPVSAPASASGGVNRLFKLVLRASP